MSEQIPAPIPGANPEELKSAFHFSAQLHLDHWQKIIHALDYCIHQAVEFRDEQELYRLQQTRNEVIAELQHAGVEFSEEKDEAPQE